MRFRDPDKVKGIRKRIKDGRIWFCERHFKEEEIERTSESYISSWFSSSPARVCGGGGAWERGKSIHKVKWCNNEIPKILSRFPKEKDPFTADGVPPSLDEECT